MNTAKFVKNINDWRGDARLYKLDTPIEWDLDEYTNYVIVSKADVPFSGWETYMFPADEDGEVISWLELDASRRGDFSHEEILKIAGYEV